MGDVLSGGSAKAGAKTDVHVSPNHWEQSVLNEHVIEGGHVQHAAVFSYEDGQVRAAAPQGFTPDPNGIKDILEALKGKDRQGLAQHGIALGSGTRPNMAGKLDKGKAIYGSDSQGGGCAILKTKRSVLAVFYERDPVQGARIAQGVAKYMKDQGH